MSSARPPERPIPPKLPADEIIQMTKEQSQPKDENRFASPSKEPRVSPTRERAASPTRDRERAASPPREPPKHSLAIGQVRPSQACPSGPVFIERSDSSKIGAPKKEQSTKKTISPGLLFFFTFPPLRENSRIDHIFPLISNAHE